MTRYFFLLCVCCLVWIHGTGQVLNVSETFRQKLDSAGIAFTMPQIETSDANARIKAPCEDLNEKLEAQASYSLQKDKKNIILAYRIKPMQNYRGAHSAAGADMANMMCNTALSNLAEGEATEEMVEMNEQIKAALKADWVHIASCKLQKKWQDCSTKKKAYHIFAFKAGKGHAEIIIFFDDSSADLLNNEIRNIMTSIVFGSK